MKRFTSTEKWDKDWFCNLSLKHKCFWHYLLDKCDAAGFWEANYRLASFQIGEPLTPDDMAAFGDRVKLLSCGKVWLTGFISFQYGRLSRECKPHQKVFDLLERYGIPLTDQNIPLPKGINTLQEEEEEKEEEVDQGELLKGEIQPPPPPPIPERIARLNRLFKRRDATKWSLRESKAYENGAELCPIDEFEMVENYYQSRVPYLRKDLQTLLINWNGEVDRARKWRENPNAAYQPANRQSNDRNANTANAGKSAAYAGVGKV